MFLSPQPQASNSPPQRYCDQFQTSLRIYKSVYVLHIHAQRSTLYTLTLDCFVFE